MIDLDQLRSQVVGEGACFLGPYGWRRATYADHAASGRAFGPVEDFIRAVALPEYANVHSETSAFAAHTVALREAARQVIRAACGCADEDAVVFTGNGATGAVHTLLACAGLERPRCDAELRGEPPVAVIGPWEHHSVEVALRESLCEVEVVAECGDGVDLDDLDARLARLRGRRVVGVFSAASNVTGRLADVPAIARHLHHAGALACFDYAARAPYDGPRLDGGGDPLAYLDAAFVSPHKLLGGPGSPGVLVAKRRLFAHRVPAVPGGGTVSSVGPHHHHFLVDVEHREEGGTPNILGAIRAGLAFQVREAAGGEALARSRAHGERLVAALAATPGVTVLGDLAALRLGVASFLVSATVGGETRLLHHGFVAALLNDLFGVQARAGNSCAGPYAHRLLGLGPESEARVAAAVLGGAGGVKPGWVRVSPGWYDPDDALDFIVAAVRFVARRGVQVLPDYDFDLGAGTWRRRGWAPARPTLLDAPVASPVAPESARWRYLAEAETIASVPRAPAPLGPAPPEGLRWFWLPWEA